MKKTALILSLLLIASTVASGQVTADRLVGAAGEPQNWLTYSGAYKKDKILNRKVFKGFRKERKGTQTA